MSLWLYPNIKVLQSGRINEMVKRAETNVFCRIKERRTTKNSAGSERGKRGTGTKEKIKKRYYRSQDRNRRWKPF